MASKYLKQQNQIEQDVWDLYEQYPVKYALYLSKQEKETREQNRKLQNYITRLQQLLSENNPETFQTYSKVITNLNTRHSIHYNIMNAKSYVKQIESDLEKKNH